MKKKILISVAIIGVLLLFTTPTPTEFKNYLEVNKQIDNAFSYGRKYNFFLFSIYTRNYTTAEHYIHPLTIKVLRYDSLKTIRDTLRSYYQNRAVFIIRNPYIHVFEWERLFLPEAPDNPNDLKEARNNSITIEDNAFPDNLREFTTIKSGNKFDTFYIPKTEEVTFLFDYYKANPTHLGNTKINADSFIKGFENIIHEPSKLVNICRSLRFCGFNIPEPGNFIDYYFNHKTIVDTTFYEPQEREVDAYTNYIGILKNFIEVKNKVIIPPNDSVWKSPPTPKY